MIFNLSHERCFPQNQQCQAAISCSSKHGPSFGADDYALNVTFGALGTKTKVYSWANYPGYYITKKDGKNMLTNLGEDTDEYFEPDEIEVWEVETLVNFHF